MYLLDSEDGSDGLEVSICHSNILSTVQFAFLTQDWIRSTGVICKQTHWHDHSRDCGRTGLRFHRLPADELLLFTPTSTTLSTIGQQHTKHEILSQFKRKIAPTEHTSAHHHSSTLHADQLRWRQTDVCDARVVGGGVGASAPTWKMKNSANRCRRTNPHLQNEDKINTEKHGRLLGNTEEHIFLKPIQIQACTQTLKTFRVHASDCGTQL